MLTKVLLCAGMMFGLYAFVGGSGTARGAAPASPASEAIEDVQTGGGGQIGTQDLTCHGQVCGPSDPLCCSCKESPTSPLQFFCGSSAYCPQGSICMVP
jgi:hypothetical protein